MASLILKECGADQSTSLIDDNYKKQVAIIQIAPTMNGRVNHGGKRRS